MKPWQPEPRSSVRWRSAVTTGFLCLTGCSSTTQDVVPSSRDVVVDGGSASQSPEGYEYVARRRGGAVALAEARGIDAPLARAAIERLADALDLCEAKRSQEAALVAGAARMIVRVADDGQIAATQLKVDPGLAPGATENAILCLLAPAKMLVFPAVDGGARAFAVEAIWGPPVSGSRPTP